MRLLRDEVYKEFEEILNQPHTIEDALKMINEDEKLQEIIRQYSIREGIRHAGGGYYCVGDEDKSIFVWRKSRDEYSDGLYLGPDANAERIPIFYRQEFIDERDWNRFNNYEVVEKNHGFYLTNDDTKDRMNGMRILDIEDLSKVSAKKILKNLEREIAKIMGGLRK